MVVSIIAAIAILALIMFGMYRAGVAHFKRESQRSLDLESTIGTTLSVYSWRADNIAISNLRSFAGETEEGEYACVHATDRPSWS